MRFRDPYFLLLFLIWIPMVWIYLRREKKLKVSIRFSDTTVLKKVPPSFFLRLRHLAALLKPIGIGFLIIALARPQKSTTEHEVSSEGIDIMLILDISNSMRALDFQPDDRLEVSKRTLNKFISNRVHDRIGLVIFAARAYTKVPLTHDHNILKEMVGQVTYTDYSNGTAIGTAIATAANRLKDSEAENQVIVLLTDGANNTGEIPPLTAARAAAELGIRIHGIGVAREGQVPFPVQSVHPFTGERTERIQMVESDLDMELLKEIAKIGNGIHFRAEKTEELQEIYAKIDELEKSEITSKIFTSYKDYFFLWIIIGFAILLLETVLQNTFFRRIP
ncbi:VWA domain-containing protein [Chitinispirillales bacterium ANBcel5]|uniref:vWA domain-containing protein n=1 Tax=Cellulosispirillum alkaliphilum TaxID=3039283 RepID=UPI002A4F4C9F|nr:VWA domain-containing protein [Chitinispirillales bacterium ANBcel5]